LKIICIQATISQLKVIFRGHQKRKSSCSFVLLSGQVIIAYSGIKRSVTFQNCFQCKRLPKRSLHERCHHLLIAGLSISAEWFQTVNHFDKTSYVSQQTPEYNRLKLSVWFTAENRFESILINQTERRMWPSKSLQIKHVCHAVIIFVTMACYVNFLGSNALA